MGVNRLSFGVQSAQADELRLLDRLHTFDQAVRAVAWARQAGFENLNLDLIYGIMGQTLSSWQDTLHRALALDPEHLSLYALTVESGTPMQARVAGRRAARAGPGSARPTCTSGHGDELAVGRLPALRDLQLGAIRSSRCQT